MKLLLLLMLTSCAFMPPVRQHQSKGNTAAQELKECVVELIDRFAVKAKTAQEVCEAIYRKRD